MKLKSVPNSADSRLNDIAQKVADWRRSRAHVRARMPDALWADVSALSDRFRPSHLGRVLRIPTKKILRKMRSADSAAVPRNVVRLAPVVFAAPSLEASATSVEMESTVGHKFRVTTTADALPGLIRAFLGGAS